MDNTTFRNVPELWVIQNVWGYWEATCGFQKMSRRADGETAFPSALDALEMVRAEYRLMPSRLSFWVRNTQGYGHDEVRWA